MRTTGRSQQHPASTACHNERAQARKNNLTTTGQNCDCQCRFVETIGNDVVNCLSLGRDSREVDLLEKRSAGCHANPPLSSTSAGPPDLDKTRCLAPGPSPMIPPRKSRKASKVTCRASWFGEVEGMIGFPCSTAPWRCSGGRSGDGLKSAPECCGGGAGAEI